LWKWQQRQAVVVAAPGNPVLFCSAVCAQHQKMAKKSECEWKNGEEKLSANGKIGDKSM
jgi:hypothetical protein